ncbi:MAG: M1 family metallopeptidase [Planctomycetota bacterium]
MKNRHHFVESVLVLFLAISLGWRPGLCRADEQAIVDSSNVAITSYSMEVEIFPKAHLLKVKAMLALTSKEDEVTELTFRLRDQFKVEKVTQAEKPLQFSQNGWSVTVEGIQVAQNPPPLVWQYQGVFKPPFASDSMSDVIVYADEIRLTYTSHWYPETAWSSGRVIKPSSRLSVEVPEGFTVVSGDHQESPPRSRNGRILYQYASRTHGSLSFAAAQYTKVAIPWDSKTLDAYFFPKEPSEKPKLIVTKLPQQEEDVLKTLKITKNIIDFYSDNFISYPWTRFALVQKSSRAAYAYGVQTYVVMNKLTYVNERSLAHELAHQWWGNLIHPVGQGERWLTESLAEYSAFLYLEHAHASKNVVEDSREFLLSLMPNMHPIRKTSFNTPNYDNIVYKIGPHVFHMLRYVVGDESFFRIIKVFAGKYTYQDATVKDFINVAQSVYNAPLDWFFDQWLDKTKNPAFVLESESTEQADNTFLVKGTITQHNTDFKMPLEIECIGEQQKEKHRIWVQGSATHFQFQVPYRPTQVKFAEKMSHWILAAFFHSEQERLAALKARPKPPPSRGKEELFQVIRNKITMERAYKLGTEIELELEVDQATRLDCVENPYGYKEILICPMKGTLYIWTFYTDGRLSGGGKSLAYGQSYAYTRALNIAVWDVKDDKVHIKFRVETEKEKIERAFKELYEKRGMNPEEIEQRLRQLFPQ